MRRHLRDSSNERNIEHYSFVTVDNEYESLALTLHKNNEIKKWRDLCTGNLFRRTKMNQMQEI